MSLVEAEITKKYINKQFGHDDENTVRNRVSSNLKNISKKYNGVDVSDDKINNFVNSLTPQNVDKAIRNNKTISSLLEEVTDDKDIIHDGKHVQNGGFFLWVFER